MPAAFGHTPLRLSFVLGSRSFRLAKGAGPATHPLWIPAFAGMTWVVFFWQGLRLASPEGGE